jgi:uncharacterized membrane protein YgcG
MKKNIKFLAILLSFLFLVLGCKIDTFEPNGYVNDFAGILSQSEHNSLEQNLVQYEQNTSVEISIIIINQLDNMDDIENFSQRIFYEWGIGKKHLNNGVLLAFSMKNHKCRIHTGYGMEGILSDIICKNLLDEELVPYFKQEKYFNGISNLVSKVESTIGSNSKDVEKMQKDILDIKNKEKDKLLNSLIDGLIILVLVLILCTIVYIFIFLYKKNKQKKIKKNELIVKIKVNKARLSELFEKNNEKDFIELEKINARLGYDFKRLSTIKHINNKILNLYENILSSYNDVIYKTKEIIKYKNDLNDFKNDADKNFKEISSLLSNTKHIIYKKFKIKYAELLEEFQKLSTEFKYDKVSCIKIEKFNYKAIKLVDDIKDILVKQIQLNNIRGNYNGIKRMLNDINKLQNELEHYGIIKKIINNDIDDLYNKIISNIDDVITYELITTFMSSMDYVRTNLSMLKESKKYIDDMLEGISNYDNLINEKISDLKKYNAMTDHINNTIKDMKKDFVNDLSLPDSKINEKWKKLNNIILFIDKIIKEKIESDHQEKLKKEKKRREEEEEENRRRRNNSSYYSSSSSLYSGSSSSGSYGGGDSSRGGATSSF